MSIKKANVDAIVGVYHIVKDAKLTKMQNEEKFAFVKIVRQLKKIGSEFDDYLEEARRRLKPDGYEAIVNKFQSGESLTPDESHAFKQFEESVKECLKDELDRDVELEIEPLSEGAIERFIASNDFSVSEIIIISDIIGK